MLKLISLFFGLSWAACPTPQSGWVQNGGNLYFKSTQNKRYGQANSACEGSNGKLAEFFTQAQFDEMKSLVAEIGQDTWIGLKKKSSCTGVDCRGKLEYQSFRTFFDAEEYPTTLQVTGMSNNCVYMTASGEVRGRSCISSIRYLCMIDCEAFPLKTYPTAPAGGGGCEFPFVYKGQLFDACTCVESPTTPRCANSVEANTRILNSHTTCSGLTCDAAKLCPAISDATLVGADHYYFLSSGTVRGSQAKSTCTGFGFDGLAPVTTQGLYNQMVGLGLTEMFFVDMKNEQKRTCTTSANCNNQFQTFSGNDVVTTYFTNSWDVTNLGNWEKHLRYDGSSNTIIKTNWNDDFKPLCYQQCTPFVPPAECDGDAAPTLANSNDNNTSTWVTPAAGGEVIK